MIYINRLLSKLGINNKSLIDDSFNTTLVQIAGFVLGVLTSIFLSRTIGAEGLGIISLSNQIVGILLMLALLGMPTVILKEVSIAYSRQNDDDINSVISTSLKFNGMLGVIVYIIFSLALPFLVSTFFHEPALKTPLMIITGAMLFQLVTRIFTAGLNGLRKIWQSNLADNTLSLFLVGFGLLVLFITGYKITVVTAAWLYAGSRVIAAFSSGIYLNSVHSITLKAKYIPRQLLRVAVPLLFAQAMNMIATSVDTIMIGWLLTATDVGYYSVAQRITITSVFIPQVIYSVIAPKIAAMYANNQTKELEQLMQKIFNVLFVVALSFIIILIIFGGIFLSIWGQEFNQAYTALLMLGIGQVVMISIGSAGLILSVCGEEKILGIITFASAVLNIMLNYFFIKWFGYTGAAISTSITMIAMCLAEAYFVKKKIGVRIIPWFT